MVEKRFVRLLKELIGSTFLILIFEAVWVPIVLYLDILGPRAPIVNYSLFEIYKRWQYSGDFVSMLVFVIYIYISVVVFFIFDCIKDVRKYKRYKKI